MEKTKKELLEIIEQKNQEIEQLKKKIKDEEERSRNVGNFMNQRLVESETKVQDLKVTLEMMKLDKIADAKLTVMLLKASASGLTHRDKERNTNLMTNIMKNNINGFLKEMSKNYTSFEDDLLF